MIKIIICAVLTFLSAISFCQLPRIDEFGTVSKALNHQKTDLLQNGVRLSNEQNPKPISQKIKNNNAEDIVKLFPPLKKLVQTSGFGNRIHPITGEYKYHNGIDFKALYEPVYNIADGKVLKSGYNNVSGNYIVIEHGLVSSVYCHLQEIYCSIGYFVKGGIIIAKSGNTGHSTGPHLHFGLRYRNMTINPQNLFQ